MVNLEVFKGSKKEWDNLIQNFEDYTIYQSYAWGETKNGTPWNIVRMIGQKGGKTVTVFQAFVRKIPGGGSLLWVPGGILGDLSFNLKPVLKELGSWFFILRVSFLSEDKGRKIILESNGWKKAKSTLSSGLSMFLYPSREDEESHRKRLSKNWRHNLNRSVKKGVHVEEYKELTPENLYGYYKEFEKNKGIGEQWSLVALQGIFKEFKNNMVILKGLGPKNEFLGLRGYLFLGRRGWDMFAISSNAGRKLYASNLVFWEMMNDCREKKIDVFDFTGIDPINNKGVYNFKKGTGAEKVEFLGEWDKSNIPGMKTLFNMAIKKMRSSL